MTTPPPATVTPAAAPATAAPASAAPAESTVQNGPAAVLAAAGFGLLMVFLGVLAWDGNTSLPNLTQVTSGLVTALLGAVINPGRTVTRATWNALGVLALLAAAAAGLAVLLCPKHLDAVPALTSAVAALAGLFVNTSAVTHPGD